MGYRRLDDLVGFFLIRLRIEPIRTDYGIDNGNNRRYDGDNRRNHGNDLRYDHG